MALPSPEAPRLREHLGRFLPRDETVQAGEVRPGEIVHRAVRMQDVDDRQIVPLADLKVGFVVRRRHFEHAGAEFESTCSSPMIGSSARDSSGSGRHTCLPIRCA